MVNNLIIKHAGTIRRMAHTRDTFQTFVFRSMAACTFIILSAFSIWVFYRNADFGCKGTPFVIQGHYSNALWMEDVFNSFRATINDSNNIYGIDPDSVCLELVIGEDRLRRGSKPVIWNPHHSYWMDIAQYDFGLEGDTVDSRCYNTTAIPMGIVAWKKVAAVLFGEGVNVVGLKQLNEQFVQGFINDTDTDRDVLLNIFLQMSLAHGHPNVTTGGLLYIIDAIDSLDGQLTSQEDIYLLAGLENQVTGYAPSDTDHLTDMLNYGPDYIKAAVSFENLVIKLNRANGTDIYNRWNDSLTFIYLNETYWVSHPLCTMEGSDWMNDKEDEKKIRLGRKFLTYVQNVTTEATLMKWGLRPLQAKYDSTVLDRSIWNAENGVDPNITANEANDIEQSLTKPTAVDLINVQSGFQQVKKPAYLHIIIDLSEKMLDETSSDSKTRWSFLRRSLDAFYTNMTDRDMVHVSCMAGKSPERYYQVACDSYDTDGFTETTDIDVTKLDNVYGSDITRELKGYYPTKNLTTERETLKAVLTTIGPQSGQAELMPMSTLQIMYQLTVQYKDYNYQVYQECLDGYKIESDDEASVELLAQLFNDCVLYNYRILLITQRRRKMRDRENLYWQALQKQLNDTPTHANMTQIYSVLYWDSDDTMTERADFLADQTGAREFDDGTGVAKTIDRLLYYF